MTKSWWPKWHEGYEIEDSFLHQRLQDVKRVLVRSIREFDRPVRIISVCAGQGRDVIEVLRDDPSLNVKDAYLFEIDPENVAFGENLVSHYRLNNVNYVIGDASITSVYKEFVPTDILMLCGIFGNVSQADIKTTLKAATTLLVRGGVVIWTRHRGEPNIVPEIQIWAKDLDFHEIELIAPPETLYAVGSNRYLGPAKKFEAQIKMFEFMTN